MKYMLRFWPLYLTAALALAIITVSANQAITTFMENRPLARDYIFVIDAGHGGEDGGAISCTGVNESQINLQIAIRLNDLLHLLGYDTKMIRSTDISVYTNGSTIAEKKISDLKNRVRLVNETDNAILLSIHQNFFQESRYYGPQVFYNHNPNAMELANTLQTNLVNYLNPGSARQCKPAQNIYLMERIRYPGLLIECGFLSNHEEEAKLRDSAYQKKLCCVIGYALINGLN